MLGKAIDDHIDNINLPSDRTDAFRCWTDSDTPHLIVRYGDQFHAAITGVDRVPLLKYMAIALERSPANDLVVFGNVLMADNIDDLTRLCVSRGLGIKEPDTDPNKGYWLIKDLDLGSIGVENKRELERTLNQSFSGW